MGPCVTVKVTVRLSLADSTSDVCVILPEQEVHQVCAELKGGCLSNDAPVNTRKVSQIETSAFQNMVFFNFVEEPPAPSLLG